MGEEMEHRNTVVIMRAVPGSGKTTIAHCIQEYITARGLSSAVHSTDDLFITPDNRYDFKVEKLAEYHAQTLHNFEQSLKEGVAVVISDNTNIEPWHTASYTSLAREYGYRVMFITFEPRTLQKHRAAQVVTAQKPDAHQVPTDTLKRVIDSYHLYTPLLDTQNKLDPIKHRIIGWSKEEQKLVPTEKMSAYFDTDATITILPNEYQKAKESIGRSIEDFMMGNSYKVV